MAPSQRAVAVLLALPGAALAQGGRTIALHPLELPYGLENPAAIQATFDSLLASQLRAAGVTVVPSAEAGAIWRRLVDSVQGFYDPITGDTVAAEYSAVHIGTLRELVARFQATTWLRPRVEVVTVEWNRGKAEWDGVSEGVAPAGKGTIGALTLVISVEDTTGAVVTTGRGGLQVLGKFKGERYERVPRERLFTDAKRNSKSVQLALAPLLSSLQR